MKKYIEAIVKFSQSRNIVPKISSILLAVILWAYISSSKSGDVKFKLPVTYTGLEENYVVSKASHKVVVVEFRGNIDDLKNISSKNIKLTVDLSKAEEGVYKPYAIQFQKIDFTDDFKIELYPEEIKILIEKKVSRNVKIIPRYSGYAEKGFMAGRIRVNPEYVKVTGPRSIVSNIGVIYTDEIPVDDKNSTFRQDIKLEKVNEEEVEYNISKVNATVPVLTYSDLTSFEIPVTIKNKKKNFKYIYNTDRVKINILPLENKNFNERSFSAYIDADEIDVDNDDFIKKSKVEVKGFIHVSGDSSDTDNSIISVYPDSVEIIVTKEN